ncbi:MAG: DUF2845 domain-containing protein [Gammaproteobacteria bacterium]|nr:DUF2845 domain-containing protein [Gammaproteobacteria bacterium]
MLRFFAILILLLCVLPVEADSLRCKRHIVDLDATKLEVLHKCGEPDFREVVSGEEQFKKEVWIYDFGAQRFMYVLTFHGLRLRRIESEPTKIRSGVLSEDLRCGTRLVSAGMTKLEVLKKCGDPEYREVVSPADDPKVEVWSYKLGSKRFLYLLTFKGVRLVKIESEDYR